MGFLSIIRHNKAVTTVAAITPTKKFAIIPSPIRDAKYWHSTTTGK